MKKPLAVVRVNRDYDAQLLEELAVEAIKPWGEFLEFSGVLPKVDEITFDPPLGPEGIRLWIMDIVRRRLEYDHPDVYLLAVMPHPIGSDTKDNHPPGWGHCHVAFVSTHPEYMNPDKRNDFIGYGKKVAAHEIGHLDPFNLEGHETRVRLPAGYCLMYVERNEDDRKSLDRIAMGLCDSCYLAARYNQEQDAAFESRMRNGRRLSGY